MKLRSKSFATPIAAIVLFAAFAGGAAAQDNFQLPRECSERHNVDPEKCVIQDGASRLPWLHPLPLNAPQKPPVTTPPTPVPTPAAVTGQMPARKAR